jgi:predicted DNA binding protein
VDEVPNGRLYRTVWNHTARGLMDGMAQANATALRGTGTEDGWIFELRFSDRRDIRNFHSYCVENEIPIRLRRIYTLAERMNGEEYGLTDTQRDTLITAYEQGYFDDPQGVTQEELAERFGVSQRAISKRIQRGNLNLIKNTLASES